MFVQNVNLVDIQDFPFDLHGNIISNRLFFHMSFYKNFQYQYKHILNKVAQWKLSVLFLGFTISVPNDDEDLITGKNLKSVMERLYSLASKGSGK